MDGILKGGPDAGGSDLAFEQPMLAITGNTMEQQTESRTQDLTVILLGEDLSMAGDPRWHREQFVRLLNEDLVLNEDPDASPLDTCDPPDAMMPRSDYW